MFKQFCHASQMVVFHRATGDRWRHPSFVSFESMCDFLGGRLTGNRPEVVKDVNQCKLAMAQEVTGARGDDTRVTTADVDVHRVVDTEHVSYTRAMAISVMGIDAGATKL